MASIFDDIESFLTDNIRQDNEHYIDSNLVDISRNIVSRLIKNGLESDINVGIGLYNSFDIDLSKLDMYCTLYNDLFIIKSQSKPFFSYQIDNTKSNDIIIQYIVDIIENYIGSHN